MRRCAWSPWEVGCHQYWYPYYVYVPVYPYGVSPCGDTAWEEKCEHREDKTRVPKELEVKAGESKQTFVGGLDVANLTLEWIKDPSAASASVTITVSSKDGDATQTLSTTSEGYQIKDWVMSVKPGCQVKVAATDCGARIRWCETLSC
jgi:hypothetical protein